MKWWNSYALSSHIWHRHQQMHLSVLTYESYVFRSLMWPSSRMCITKDQYIAVLQVLRQCTEINYRILKIIHGLKYILKNKVQIKIFVFYKLQSMLFSRYTQSRCTVSSTLITQNQLYTPCDTTVCFFSNETPTWCNTVQVLFSAGSLYMFRAQAPIIRSI